MRLQMESWLCIFVHRGLAQQSRNYQGFVAFVSRPCYLGDIEMLDDVDGLLSELMRVG